MPRLKPSPGAPLASATAILLAVFVAACGGGTAPSPSRIPLPTDPSATGSPSGSIEPSPGPIGTPSRVPWPTGWDSAFCDAFAELVVTQELAVDIGRALDEDERADARGLTAELATSATTTRELLGEIPAWTTDEGLRADISALLDLADEVALRYDRYLNQGRRQALGNAQAAGRQMPAIVEPLLEKVTLLADQGLACPGLAFDLETPADQ